MTNNLPADIKQDWVNNDIVMPPHVNSWSSAINQIKDVIPTYASTGDFYQASYNNNVYNLSPIQFADNSQNVCPTSYLEGMRVIFKCPADNQASCSVNVNSLGSKSIKKTDGSNVEAGLLKSGYYVELRYDAVQGYFKVQSNMQAISAEGDGSYNNIETSYIRHFNSISALRSASLKIGQKCFVSDYTSGNEIGNFYSIRQKTQNDQDNGGTILVIDANTVAELINYDDFVDAKDFGCVADANYYDSDTQKWYTSSAKTQLSTDNYTNLVAAITYADKNNKFLKFEGKFCSSQDIILPRQKGMIGNGGIVGCDCYIDRVQPYYTQNILYFDKLYICGSYSSEYDKLFVYGDIILKGNGPNNENYGFFWNKFRAIQCQGKLLFDMDGGHSINQNIFENLKVSGGIHIKGTSTTPGKVSCNSNIFINLDTSGANITASDGTDGYQVLNESYANQCNAIINWYSESSAGKIKGKWNILGATQVPTGTNTNGSLLFNRENHLLFTQPDDTRQIGDFFSGTPVNRAEGGNWKHLGKNGTPLGIVFNNTVGEVIGVDDAPDGNPLALRIRNEVLAGFANMDFKVPISQSIIMTLTAYIKIVHAPDLYANLAKPVSGASYPTFSLTPLQNGWYLVRMTGQTRTLQEKFNLFTGKQFNDGSMTRAQEVALDNWFAAFRWTLNLGHDTITQTPEIILGSYFISNERTAFLPQFEQGPKEARLNSTPTGGIWKIGDKCYNSVPTSGQPIGWVCTTSGDYRTLSDTTGSITAGTTELTVNDTSLLYVGANISIAGVTGNKIITKIEENTITIDSNSDATVTDGAITFVTPVWASMGNLT